MRRSFLLILVFVFLSTSCIFGTEDERTGDNTGSADTGGDADTGMPSDTGVPDSMGSDADTGMDADTQPTCTPPQEFCGGGCVNTTTSPEHCGGCDNPCGVTAVGYTEACVASMCEATSACAEGYVDLDQDSANGCECEVTDAADSPADGVDSNCDGFDGNLAASVFVAEGAGDNGSLEAPMGSLQDAVDRVAGESNLSQVIVSAGTYSEGLTLADGVTVAGGYSDDFQEWDPQSNQTVIEGLAASSEPGELHTVSVDGVSSAELAGFQIRGSDPTERGASTIVLYALDADGLLLRQLTLEGANAAKGADGQDAPATDINSCDPYEGGAGADPEAVNPCAQLSNATSNPGSDGKPFQSPGIGGEGGAHRCSELTGVACVLTSMAGSNGLTGKDGPDGDDGQPATDGVGLLKDGRWVPLASDPPSSGTKGTGGGGGGAGGNCGTGQGANDYDLGGGGGDGGRGGCGGAAGENGASGGASILLLAVNSDVTLEDIDGELGKGGDGGSGSEGATGESRQLATDVSGEVVVSAGNGGDGSAGGAGGDGGHGAGGCGGPAYGIARDSASTVTGELNLDASAFEASQPGDGAAGAPAGCEGAPGVTALDKLISDGG